MEEIMNSKSSSETKKSETPKENEAISVAPTSRSGIRESIINILRKDLNKSYTIKELSKKLKSNRICVRNIIRALKETKKIKIVGWEYREGYPGASALSYQLIESTLPKLKVTTDNNSYLTLKQFYKKKLRGKRCTSMKNIEQIIRSLPVTPLIINKRAYAGYATSDLKEAFKEYLDLPSPKKTRSKVKPVKINTAEIPVSNPISEKKTVFNFFSSLFRKKEEIHS
jgi:hypothetical protein